MALQTSDLILDGRVFPFSGTTLIAPRGRSLPPGGGGGNHCQSNLRPVCEKWDRLFLRKDSAVHLCTFTN